MKDRVNELLDRMDIPFRFLLFQLALVSLVIIVIIY